MASGKNTNSIQSISMFELATDVESIAHSISYLAAELDQIANGMEQGTEERKALMGLLEYANTLSQEASTTSTSLYATLRTKNSSNDD